ncbi:uncharacterized protein LOC143143497 [Ptiloglossa arizonensis]|uniref:uncharacterized protein LOC143143497 n=1 Tax=Ptiloglossa arizonensis TaxID=3350558 RepID=UPI003F9F920C
MLYYCVICQHVNTSITDLHNHYVQHHTPQELSHSIINFQGLKFVEEKKLKSIVLGNNNNNKNICDEVIVKTEKQNSHDETYCLLNCSQFIVWEHELNKRTEICDSDFFNIIEDFCTNLSKKKQKGRKRKNKAVINENRTESIIQHNEDKNIQTQSETIKKFNDLAPQISTATTSSWNVANSNTNTAANEMFKAQITGEVITEDDVSLTLIEIDTNQNVLLINPVDDNCFFTTIIIMNADEEEISIKEIL